MKCPKPPLRTVVKMNVSPYVVRASDGSDTLKTDIDREPQSLAKKALAMLHNQQADLMDATEGEIIAVLIDSPIVGPVWFALNDDFKSGDEIPVFFMSEVPYLDKMEPAELCLRYQQKLALGGGWIRERNDERQSDAIQYTANMEPICWNCDATMTKTKDIYGTSCWVCWECAKTA